MFKSITIYSFKKQLNIMLKQPIVADFVCKTLSSRNIFVVSIFKHIQDVKFKNNRE